MRDNRTVAQILANSLNRVEYGSGSRTLATVGQLQSLQQIFKSNDDEGSINQTKRSVLDMWELFHSRQIDQEILKKSIMIKKG